MGNATKTRGRRLKKRWFAGIFLIIAVLSVFGFLHWPRQNAAAQANSAPSSLKTFPLEKTTLVNSISASGTLYSSQSQNVYTTHNYPIQDIFVEVGDEVKSGDVLAVLDMTNLDYDIQQAEINLRNSRLSASENQKSINAGIQNAENALASAVLNVTKQEADYKRLEEELANETSQSLVSAKNAVDTAEQTLRTSEKDLQTKREDYDKNLQLLNGGAIPQNDLDTVKHALDSAGDVYQTALSDYQKAMDNLTQTRESLSKDLETAAKDLESAALSQQNAQNGLTQAKSKTETTAASIEIQEISLTKLKEQRAEANITAPIDGTVTQVNAAIGSTATGSSGSGSSGSTLFVVEDMNDLYISTSVKEFRIGEVAFGQEAYITTDATGDRMFRGVLDFIAPIATETSSTTNVEFEVRISLQDADPLLKIGMNAYAAIVVEAKENVYAVGYDAIQTVGPEQNVVFALENNKVVALPVTLGLENDTSIEISGEGLREGMTLFQTASAVTEGQIIEESRLASTDRQNISVPAGRPSDLDNNASESWPDSDNASFDGQRPEGSAPPAGMRQSEAYGEAISTQNKRAVSSGKTGVRAEREAVQ